MDYAYPDDSDKSTAMEVITRVAAWKGIDPVELEPLSHTINPYALDALFTGTTGSGQISFRYSNCEVIIENGDQVIVQDLQVDSDSITDTATSQEGKVEQ